jgi:hypothetical protein
MKFLMAFCNEEKSIDYGVSEFSRFASIFCFLDLYYFLIFVRNKRNNDCSRPCMRTDYTPKLTDL